MTLQDDPAPRPGPHPAMAPIAADTAAATPITIDPQLLERFSRLMASRDWPVDSPHMQRGSPYAYKRLALAYGSGDAALRALSVTLYHGYQAQGPAKAVRRARRER